MAWSEDLHATKALHENALLRLVFGSTEGVISRTGQEAWCKYLQIHVLLGVLYTLSLQTWCPTLVIHQRYTMKHQYIFPEAAYIRTFMSTGYSYELIQMVFTWSVLIILAWNSFVCLFHVVPRLSFEACPAPSTDVSYVCATRCCEQAQKAEGWLGCWDPVSNGVQSWPCTTWQREGLGPRR